jgi:2-methylcitrate dehydratase PrpD
VTSPEAELGRFAVELRFEDLRPASAAAAKRLLLDAFASALAGHSTAERPAMERLACALFGAGQSSVIAGDRLAPAGAALLNGFNVTAATICDVHRSTLTHVTPEVVPAVLAAAEAVDATGREVLAALVVGLEITVRVAEALDVPAYRARGWHNPGISGVIGAAASVARLHGLGVTGIRHAMGHAASQAAGTFAALGTSGVKMHQARGAVSGLFAGSLAAAGFDGAEDALTAPRGGLLAAYAGGGEPDRLVDGLGHRFAFESIALRRWSAASSLQPVIAATLAARAGAEAQGVEPGHEAIASARVDLPPRAHALNGAGGWDSQLAALQSARWIVAVVLNDGDCWVTQTAPDRLADPLVGYFAAERVAVTEDPALPETGARITLTDRAGREHISRVDVPPGDPRAPLGDDLIRAKLERAAAGVGLGHRVAAIAESVASLERATSISPLLELLRA